MSGSGGSKKRKLNVLTDEERAAIVAESFAPGATVVGVARKHGVQPNLLSSWRSASQQAKVTSGAAGPGSAKREPSFAAVEVTPAIVPSACPDAIEITAGSVVIRLPLATPPPRIVEIARGLARS